MCNCCYNDPVICLYYLVLLCQCICRDIRCNNKVIQWLCLMMWYITVELGRYFWAILYSEGKKISHIFKIRILVFCYALNETTYKCRYPLSGAVTPRYYRSSDKGRFLNLSQCVKNRNTWRIRRNGELFGFHALAMFK